MLQRQDIQAVIIALPIVAQPEYVKKALSAGKHVLSEKPIAADSKTARDLLSFYENKVKSKATWGVAENIRFLHQNTHARKVLASGSLGKVQGFRTTMQVFVQPGNKYFETPWRKTPAYQGGFLLDGGIHSVAASRFLLGEDPTSVVAFTKQQQEHLPPVDTVDALWRTASGVHGAWSVSFGSTFSVREHALALEKGTVTVGEVTPTSAGVRVRRTGEDEEATDCGSDFSCVGVEVKAWAEALEKGTVDERLDPKEALRDLLVLEAMLRSGEKGGEKIEVEQV